MTLPATVPCLEDLTRAMGHILCDGVIGPVAALGPEVRRSCDTRYRVLKASGHLHDDPAWAPVGQGDALH